MQREKREWRNVGVGFAEGVFLILFVFVFLKKQRGRRRGRG
jgi:hypothetical protein